MTAFAIVLDVVVALLLVATIVYATVLNRKLATLRNTKQEMETLVNRLAESTGQAETALGELKAAAGETGGELDSQVRRAGELRDDLAFMIEKADRLADRLETQIGHARAKAQPAGEPRQAPANAATAPGEAVRDKPAAMKAGKSKSGAASVEADDTARQADDPPPANAKLLRALRGVR